MKRMLEKIWSPLPAVIWNLLLVYLTYQIARLEYAWENAQYLTYTTEVFTGGLLFDTSAILYTNVLYIVMMLFPLHWKENNVWHRICQWVFVVVNSLAFAINLMDSVYFQYTMRRTTSTVFSEFSNEGNLFNIIGTELFRHWYLVLLFAIVVVLLWKLYANPKLDYRKMLHWWRYDAACLLSLAVIAPLCVAGMRGGWTRDIRPITVAVLLLPYAPSPSRMPTSMQPVPLMLR